MMQEKTYRFIDEKTFEETVVTKNNVSINQLDVMISFIEKDIAKKQVELNKLLELKALAEPEEAANA